MGCVSSTLLSHDDHDFTQIGGSTSFGHHIVKLTSTTYGLLTLDPPPPSSDYPFPSTTTTTIIPPTPPPRFTLTSPPLKPDDIINSWELMAGLDSSSSVTPTPPPPLHRSFRFSPPPASTNENSNPNLPSFHKTLTSDLAPTKNSLSPLDEFEKLCPPNGENKVVIYTTTLRGIRKTFEDCNAVRLALQGFGVIICERDISMDRGFRDELRELMMTMMNKSQDSKTESLMIPPRVFIKGRYIGGVEEIMRIAEDGILGNLLSGLPKMGAANDVCEGCGGTRFLPCFQCNGSCKMVNVVEVDTDQTHTHNSPQRTVVVRCSHCNENGLVLCPICT